MGANNKVARENHTIEELRAIVADAETELAEAARGDHGSRVYREAETVLRFYERGLNDALAAKERSEKDEKRDPKEIVDRVMGL